jgi:hypothetical protein
VVERLSSSVLSIAVGDPTRVVLLAVIVLLAAILVGLVALLVAIRRRPALTEPAPEPAPPLRPAAIHTSPPPRPLAQRSAPRVTASAGGGLQVAASGMVCPTCRTEYAGMTYCQRDARRLVAAEEILAGGRGPGGVCVSCRRAFDPGLRKCPHDGAEVIPAPLYWATRGRRDRDAAVTGVEAKICPACRRRYDLSARFCGRDGAELVVVN